MFVPKLYCKKQFMTAISLCLRHVQGLNNVHNYIVSLYLVCMPICCNIKMKLAMIILCALDNLNSIVQQRHCVYNVISMRLSCESTVFVTVLFMYLKIK